MNKELVIVAVSDTHASSAELQQLIDKKVEGDIFIHAGDFTHHGRQQHFINFFKCLEQLQFRHKIVIAGNHDTSLDPHMSPKRRKQILDKYPCSLTRQVILKELRARAHYLEHELIQIEGLKIFGSPYTIKYSHNAFQYKKEDDKAVWSNLPNNIDILVTHNPPFGILDTSAKGSAGSHALLQAVRWIKPKLHVFGHIHGGHGREMHQGTYFMNVAKKYQIFNWQ